MFFALEREEVVEERPFRAVKKESFRKRALALVPSFRHTYRDHAARLTLCGVRERCEPGTRGHHPAELLQASFAIAGAAPGLLKRDVMQIHRLNRTQTTHGSSDRPGTRGLIWRQRALACFKAGVMPGQYNRL
jgi:hypothetical protein